MTDIRDSEFLVGYTGEIVDIEVYYILIKSENGISVRLLKWYGSTLSDTLYGPYQTKEETMNFIKEYKEKIEKLAEFENELF